MIEWEGHLKPLIDSRGEARTMGLRLRADLPPHRRQISGGRTSHWPARLAMTPDGAVKGRGRWRLQLMIHARKAR